MPLALGAGGWAIYMLMDPKPALFGEAGLLKFARDLLIMGVPFMVGALAAVAMGSPGPHLDRRPAGVELYLDGSVLTLRQFVCYLLGYLSFLGLTTLAAAVGADLLRDPVVHWLSNTPKLRLLVHATGALVLSCLLAALSVTVLWALYFLTHIVNRDVGTRLG